MKKIAAVVVLCFFVTIIWAQTKNSTGFATRVVTVNSTDWKLIGNANRGGCYLSDTIKWEALTKEVFDNGAVMAYVLGTGGGGWYALPHAYYGKSARTEVSFNYREGYLELRMTSLSTGKSKSHGINFPAYKYKIVVFNQ